jgi:O-antigen/teichoic acid export membrane protein
VSADVHLEIQPDAIGGGSTPGLQSSILNGLVWKVTSQVVLQLSRVVVGIALARLLSPHDYGLAGMVLVFASLVLVFSDLAFGAALVQRKVLTEADRSTVFWTSVAAGLGFTLIGFALSWPIADFFGEPEVQPLFAALSLSFVVASIGTTQTALLTRAMSFRALEMRTMASGLVGAAVGLSLAFAGAGAWAIIAQQLTIVVVGTIIIFAATPWRPHLVFSVASLRDLGGFSGNVLGQRLVFYVHRNADNLLIGRFLGASALGVYALAYNVMLQPMSRIAAPVQETLFPAFSRMQGNRQMMADAWVRATRLVGALTVPSLCGLVVVAPDFVTVVLGERWSEAVPVIQILSWVGLLQSLQALNGDMLQALDRTTLLFRYSLFFFAAHMTAFACGLPFGVVGVAVAYAISSTVVEPTYCYLTSRAVGISMWTFLGGLFGVLQASAVMTIVVLGARLGLESLGVGAPLRLVACILLGLAVYPLVLRWRAPEVPAEIRAVRARRRAAAAEPVAE